MRTTSKFFLAASVAALSSSASLATELKGGNYYVGAGLGYNIPETQNLDHSGGGSVDIEFDENISYSLQAGYKLPKSPQGRFRIEGELGYRQGDASKVSAAGTSTTPTGDQSVLSGMVNGYYDFTNVHKNITPYIGAGVGIAQVKMNDLRNNGAIIDGDSTNFAWQVMAGADFPVAPNTSLYVDGRYFQVVNNTFTETGLAGEYESDYSAFTASTGIKYDF